jgi:hypothetical protein
MALTYMEFWDGKVDGTCYLQMRDGEVWACWIGRPGNQFRNLEAARKWLTRQGYKFLGNTEAAHA